MRIWKSDGSQAISLTDALCIEKDKIKKGSKRDCCVISVIGGGGKTSLVYCLSRELAAYGFRTAITTTTHMMIPQEFPWTDDIGEAVRMLEKGPVLVAHKVSSKASLYRSGKADKVVETDKTCKTGKADKVRKVDETGKFNETEDIYKFVDTNDDYLTQEKCGALTDEEYAILLKGADVILIEADGARQFPLKAAAAYEPAIMHGSDYVIAVAGIDAVGQPLYEACHRPWLAADRFGLSLDTKVTEEIVARLLLDPAIGQMKGISTFSSEHEMRRPVITFVDASLRAACSADSASLHKAPAEDDVSLHLICDEDDASLHMACAEDDASLHLTCDESDASLHPICPEDEAILPLTCDAKNASSQERDVDDSLWVGANTRRDMQFRVLINKADDEKRRVSAFDICSRLSSKGIISAVSALRDRVALIVLAAGQGKRFIRSKTSLSSQVVCEMTAKATDNGAINVTKPGQVLGDVGLEIVGEQQRSCPKTEADRQEPEHLECTEKGIEEPEYLRCLGKRTEELEDFGYLGKRTKELEDFGYLRKKAEESEIRGYFEKKKERLKKLGYSEKEADNKLDQRLGDEPLFAGLFRAVRDLAADYGDEIVHEKILVTQESRHELCMAAEADGFKIVFNRHPEGGISSSIKLGIEAVEKSEAYLFTVCDQPKLTGRTFYRLIEAYQYGGGLIAAVRPSGVYGDFHAQLCTEPDMEDDMNPKMKPEVVPETKSVTEFNTESNAMPRILLDERSAGKAPDERKAVGGSPNIFSNRFRDDLLALEGDVGGKMIIRKHMKDTVYVDVPAKELFDVDTIEDLRQVMQ